MPAKSVDLQTDLLRSTGLEVFLWRLDDGVWGIIEPRIRRSSSGEHRCRLSWSESSSWLPSSSGYSSRTTGNAASQASSPKSIRSFDVSVLVSTSCLVNCYYYFWAYLTQLVTPFALLLVLMPYGTEKNLHGWALKLGKFWFYGNY